MNLNANWKVFFTMIFGLVSMTVLAQNTVTLQKRGGKQRVVDMDKIFAIDTDATFFEGRVVGQDGVNFQMAIPTDSAGQEQIYNIPISTVNGLWLCPKTTPEKCDKWHANQDRNDILIVSVMAPLFVGNLVAIATNRIRLSLGLISGMSIIFSTYGTMNNPKRLKLNKKWIIVTQ